MRAVIETVCPLVMDVLFRIRSVPDVPTVPSITAVPPLVVIRNQAAVLEFPAVALPMELAVNTDGWAELAVGANGEPQVCVERST